MEFMNVIKDRQSCRAFTGETITENELNQIIQAANSAPVAMGEYADMQLSVIQNKELLAKLEANAYSAMPAISEHPMYGASTVIAISCKKGNDSYAWTSASCIAENMLLAATDLGLGSIYLMAVPVTAQSNPELCKELKIDDDFAPYVMVGVGKPQNAPEKRELTTKRIHIEYIR